MKVWISPQIKGKNRFAIRMVLGTMGIVILAVSLVLGVAILTIYTDEYNGKECYVLCLTSDYKKWIDKDTGLVIKTESGENSTTEISDIEIDNIKEIYKPDLTGFEIEDEKIEE